MLLAALQFHEATPNSNGDVCEEHDLAESTRFTTMNWPLHVMGDTNVLFQKLLKEVPDFLCNKNRPKLQRNHWHTLIHTNNYQLTWGKLQKQIVLLIEQVILHGNPNFYDQAPLRKRRRRRRNGKAATKKNGTPDGCDDAWGNSKWGMNDWNEWGQHTAAGQHSGSYHLSRDPVNGYNSANDNSWMPNNESTTNSRPGHNSDMSALASPTENFSTWATQQSSYVVDKDSQDNDVAIMMQKQITIAQCGSQTRRGRMLTHAYTYVRGHGHMSYNSGNGQQMLDRQLNSGCHESTSPVAGNFWNTNFSTRSSLGTVSRLPENMLEEFNFLPEDFSEETEDLVEYTNTTLSMGSSIGTSVGCNSSSSTSNLSFSKGSSKLTTSSSTKTLSMGSSIGTSVGHCYSNTSGKNSTLCSKGSSLENEVPHTSYSQLFAFRRISWSDTI